MSSELRGDVVSSPSRSGATRLLRRWPLRHSAPIVLAVGAIVALVINGAWSIRVADGNVMRTSATEIRGDMVAATGSIERRRASDDAVADALLMLQSDPGTDLAFAVGPSG